MKTKKLLAAVLVTFALLSSGVSVAGSKQPPPEQEKPVVVDWFSTIFGPLNLF